MELRQLRYLVEIVRLGSFARAASVLGITQPALSKSMRTLECELGVTVLERAPGGVTATPFGRILVDRAERTLIELDRAVEEIHALNGGGRGLVQVGGSTTVLRLLLPRIVRAMGEEARTVKIVVVEGLRDDLMTALRAGRLDVALSLTPDPELAEEFRVEPLLTDDLCFVVRQDHPLLSLGRAVSLADLCAYRWIMPNLYESERRQLAQRFAAEDLPPPDIAVQTSSSVIMASMLCESDHISYLPRAILTLGDFAQPLRALPLAARMRGPDICLVTRRSGVALGPVRAFIAATKEVLGEIRAAIQPA